MQVIIHAGAHGTEEDRLMKTLLRNKEGYLARGTAVPGPAKYRSLLKDCMAATKTDAPSENARELLWDAILEDENADRVILSNPHFFGSQRDALEGQRLYSPTTTCSCFWRSAARSVFCQNCWKKPGPGGARPYCRKPIRKICAGRHFLHDCALPCLTC